MKNYANTAEGCLAISLVRDFLDYFGLEFTLSVFDPEVGLGKDYGFENKENIRRKLSLGKNSGKYVPGHISVFRYRWNCINIKLYLFTS